MGQTKDKLRGGQVALGGWVMTGSPVVAEIMAGEDFDFLGVDMEHTAIDYPVLQQIAMAAKASGTDLLARLESADAVVQAKRVLDAGATGIIVPMVNSRQEAELAAAMARFPPAGIRGAAFSRASDYGRNFGSYFETHNDSVIVAVMMEHIRSVENADEILSVPGIDATFIGPYDLSTSMGKPGQLDDSAVQEAIQTIFHASVRHGVAPGLHVVQTDADEVARRVEQGFRFVACGLDTEFIVHSCRSILGKVRANG